MRSKAEGILYNSYLGLGNVHREVLGKEKIEALQFSARCKTLQEQPMEELAKATRGDPKRYEKLAVVWEEPLWEVFAAHALTQACRGH